MEIELRKGSDLMQAPADTRKSVSYKRTFRRHRKLLSVPMVLGVLVAAYFIFASSPSYLASASLWVDTAPPNASSVGASTLQLTVTPATSEQSVLTELLSTQSFAVAVARGSQLGKYIQESGVTPFARAAMDALENKQVTASVAGPQVLQISYKGPTPEVATTTVNAIVRQLQQASSGLSSQHDQAAVSYYQAQVQQATRALDTARNQVAAYLVNHPRSTSQSDPNLSALMAAETGASNQLTQATTSLNQASASRAGGGWMVQLIDAPKNALSQVMRKKKMLEILLGGLFGGALVSLLGTIALTPAREERWEDELTSPRAAASGDPLEDLVNGGSVGHGSPMFASEGSYAFETSGEEFGER